MSSFIGHALTGATCSLYHRQTSVHSRIWLSWLVLLAIFPDSEYGVLWLSGVNFSVRFTHSIVFCALLPLCALLFIKRYTDPSTHTIRIIQTFAAAYSHLALDLLVGVYPLPLLWPFTKTAVTLPFGILPSAGRLSVTNWYLYRNLIIELGIFVPCYSFLLLKERIQQHRACRLILAVYVMVWIPFLVWGASLTR